MLLFVVGAQIRTMSGRRRNRIPPAAWTTLGTLTHLDGVGIAPMTAFAESPSHRAYDK